MGSIEPARGGLLRGVAGRPARSASGGSGISGWKRGSDAELSILLTGDSGMRELNRKYRSIDRPTDVLSFPMDDETLMGAIAISVEKAKSQAEDMNVALGEELSRLVVHGILHLAGYDHAQGGRQARRMREKEEELLKALKAEGCF